MSSQVRAPSTDQFLYLLNEFPGLQFHRQDPNLPYNRFELELVEAGSKLNTEILSTYCVQSEQARVPQFTYVQLVTLALLSSPARTLSVKEILQWICARFPGISARQQREHARGVSADEECVTILMKRISAYCQLSETNWYCDLVATGEFENPHTPRQNSNWPQALSLSYHLPWGVEEEKFAPVFNMMHLHDHFGMAPQFPPPDMKAGERRYLTDLPRKIKIRILSNLLAFSNPLSVVWNKDRGGPIVAVFLPPALRTNRTRPVRNLWVPPRLLAVLQVCKEFENLGRFAFYSMNTFLVDTTMQPEHPNVLNLFLSRIGFRSRQLIRSVQFNINMLHHTDKMIKDSIAKLGESYCLQFITLDIRTATLAKKARDDPANIVGLSDPSHRFQSILRFKGLKHVTIFNHPTAQIYADVCLKFPYAYKEDEIVNERTDAVILEEEEDKKRPSMTLEEISEMAHTRKRRQINLAEHERQLERRKRLEKVWAGAAGMTVNNRSKHSIRPILDEVVLVQRPGLEDGYLGADPRVKGPGVGHGKVYDLNMVWGDQDMKENMQNILRLMRPEMDVDIAAPEMIAQPMKKKRKSSTPMRGTTPAFTTPSPSSVVHDLPKKKVKKSSLPAVAESLGHKQGLIFDTDEVDKSVDEVLALEAKYSETMKAEEAKKAALRAVFSKVMHKGVDTD